MLRPNEHCSAELDVNENSSQWQASIQGTKCTVLEKVVPGDIRDREEVRPTCSLQTSHIPRPLIAVTVGPAQNCKLTSNLRMLLLKKLCLAVLKHESGG